MAASGKKNKKKWKPVAINELLDSTPVRTPVGNWADEVDEEDANSYEIKAEKYVLPTAPRASRGTTIDESKVPYSAPFQAYLSNIPYDLTENELINFFQNLKVKSVRLPRDEKGGNRAKGYGYIEFEDRSSLISALTLGENTLKGRPIRIELTTSADNNNRPGRGNRGLRDGGRSDMGGGGSDRTAGNWRTGPRDDFDDRGGGGSGYDRGGYGSGRRDFGGGGGGGFSRNYEDRSFFRDERGPDRDRFGRGDDRSKDDFRERGGFNQGGFDRGGFGGRDRDDRGFSRDRDDRGFSRDRDDGRGFSRDRDDRGGFSSFSDRSDRGGGGGSFTRRDDDRFNRGDDQGGNWREGGRENFSRMDDRRDRDRFGGGGGVGRRDDLPPIDRGGGGGGGGNAEVKVRPKLKLLPRSNTTPAENESEAPAASSSIFGGAKPVDTAAREREIEERLRRGDDPPDIRSKPGPGSTGSGSQKDGHLPERRAEPAPAPPPKDNPWSRKAAAAPTAVVNNGRTSPEDVRQTGGGGGGGGGSSGHLSDDDKNESSRSWNRGGDNRRQETKRIEKNDESRNRGPQQHKGGAGGNISSEKSRAKDEKPISKHREPRKEIDDISRMPKIQENKVPSKRTFYRNRNR
ncbi:hypothetical protein O3M35_010076 [Rhynocoris fuscipes]|uniref:RRM domain-containing protein n=1 Tax=Rhynocoris fuscipes TaxID=488301 RepID=A0AAW1CYX6_9HEMI